MRIAIIGANGMLGSDLYEILRAKKEFDVIPFYGKDRDNERRATSDGRLIVDITNQLELEKEIVKIKPDVIIHTAAWTDVDGCEANRKMAYQVNALGTQNVVLAAKKSRAFLIYISTDYVFDGEKKSPYRENDEPNPMSFYGKTKLSGEKFVQDILNNYAIIRTSWLFGKNGKNFIKAIVKQINERRLLKVVDDQIGSPTYTRDLSKGISFFLEKACLPARQGRETGIYHLTNQGFCSWFEFAKKIVKLTGNVNKIIVEPINSSQLTRPAKRPHNSILGNYVWKLKGYPLLQDWEDALKEYLNSSQPPL